MKGLYAITLALLVATAAPSAEKGFHDRNQPYRLQVMDVVEVRYRYTPELNETLDVRPDGVIGSQVAGEIAAKGLTVEQLRQALTERASAKLRDPDVQVLLKAFVPPHYTVAGEVTKPGQFPIRSELTVLEAIAVAGGFNPNAKHSQVLLVRRLEDDMARVVELNLKQMMKDPFSAEDPIIRADDLLIIPTSKLSKVERIVKWSNVGIFWNPSI